MKRAFALCLLSLPLAGLLAAGSASAQNYPAPYYSSSPPPGYQVDPDNPDQAIRMPRQEAQQQDEAVPNRAPAPIDQDDAEATPNRAPFYFGAPADGANAPRPPAQVGTAPRAAPQPATPPSVAALPPEDQPEQGPEQALPANLQRQLVDFRTKEPAGTIIIDTPHTYLYLVLGRGQAIRYGIGVGREGFTWSGVERISRMKEWPDWYPPPEMIERQPYLPRMMAGGPGNPLGARALYLGHTLYRIHGTNQPSTIGKFVSSGCIRLLNRDIEDLYSRVQVGTRVVVMPGKMPSPDELAKTGARNSIMVEPDDSGTAISGRPLPAPR
jgi:lipoprotein-anchoring transpeptidase ErfK/SrfK